MADLDSILSGASAVAPAPEVVTTEANQAEVTTQEHDQQTGNEGEGGQKMVPHEALHAEKLKVKRYTEQVADFDRRLAELNAANDRRFAEILSAVKPKEDPKPETPVVLEPWDPGYDDYVRAPLKEQLQSFQKDLAETRFVMSRNAAVASFGAEAITAADDALTDAVKRGELDGSRVRQQLESSRDPVGDVVRWHKNSPAVKEKELRETIRAELLTEMQGGNPAPAAQAAAPVMPSNLAGARNVGNRSGPAWSGPQPLTDIFKR